MSSANLVLAIPLLVFVIVQRLWELYISRRRVEADAAKGRAEYIREAIYPLMVLAHAGWIAGCVVEPWLTQAPFRPAIGLPALAMFALAVALRVWLQLTLGRLWNVRLVKRSDQPVIVAGPYRYLRHPNYLAVILELAAVPLALGAYWTVLLASIANALVLWRRIAREEAYLFSVPGYVEAFAGKKRLIPGLF